MNIEKRWGIDRRQTTFPHVIWDRREKCRREWDNPWIFSWITTGISWDVLETLYITSQWPLLRYTGEDEYQRNYLEWIKDIL